MTEDLKKETEYEEIENKRNNNPSVKINFSPENFNRLSVLLDWLNEALNKELDRENEEYVPLSKVSAMETTGIEAFSKTDE